MRGYYCGEKIYIRGTQALVTLYDSSFLPVKHRIKANWPRLTPLPDPIPGKIALTGPLDYTLKGK